jgi:hypothetical protein
MPLALCLADRAWNPRHNGVKRQEVGGNAGYFGAVNLLGPRSLTQRPFSQFWSDTFTIVQLRFDFLREATDGAYQQLGLSGLVPIELERTFISFYDLDTGEPTFARSSVQVEAIQMGPQAVDVQTMNATELQTFNNWPELLGSDPRTTSFGGGVWPTWSGAASRVYAGSTYGVGDDNPINPYLGLTPQQRNRALMAMFERATTFQVRFAIHSCCTTGSARTRFQPTTPARTAFF